MNVLERSRHRIVEHHRRQILRLAWGRIFGLPTGDRAYSYSLDAEFFPTDRLSARIGYVKWADDPLRDRAHRFGATYFFAPSFGMDIDYQHMNAPVLRGTTRVTVGLIGRF